MKYLYFNLLLLFISTTSYGNSLNNMNVRSINFLFSKNKAINHTITIDDFLSKFTFSLVEYSNAETELIVSKDGIILKGSALPDGFHRFNMRLRIDGNSSFIPISQSSRIVIFIANNIPIISFSEILNLDLSHGHFVQGKKIFEKPPKQNLYFKNTTKSDLLVYVLQNPSGSDKLKIFSIPANKKFTRMKGAPGIYTFLIYEKSINRYFISTIYVTDKRNQKFQVNNDFYRDKIISIR